jgi:hypothetical protein
MKSQILLSEDQQTNNASPVTELLTSAITRIAQHACRQGENSSRIWPPLSELPELKSWEMVGRQYAQEIAIEIFKMYFNNSNFLNDLTKLASQISSNNR